MDVGTCNVRVGCDGYTNNKIHKIILYVSTIIGFPIFMSIILSPAIDNSLIDNKINGFAYLYLYYLSPIVDKI